MRNHNICFVVQSMQIGGSSQLVHDLAIQFSKDQRNEVSVVVFFDDINSKYCDIVSDSRIHFYSLHKKLKIDLPFFVLLKKTIKTINPSIISSHLSCIFFLNLFVDYHKTTVFHTIHNKPTADLPWIYRIAIFPNVKRKKIHLIGCSQYVAKEAEQYYKVPVSGIQNGIVLPTFKAHSVKKKYDYLCVARFTSIKRIAFLVECFRRCLDSDPKLTLCLCGCGPEERRILQTIDSFGIRKNVFLFSPPTDVGTLYEQSRIFCLFSSREGAPISIIEAMSYGLPIIASNVNGVPDLVHDKVNGFLVNPFNQDDIVNKMVLLASSSTLLSQMSLCSTILSKSFSIEETARQYFNLLVSTANGEAALESK